LSEATCSVTLNPIDGRRNIGSIGVPLPGQQVKIVDHYDAEVPARRVGEIVVRGPNVMQGYYGNPEATRATIRNGWLHTGDLGTVDDEGYLYIVGRKKEMIIRGGENIYPKEIEEVLYRHPAILEAAVVGMPHPIWGEEVVAVVVLREGQPVSEQDLIDYCKQHLADYKCPRQVRLVVSFPKTATGKIQKRELVKTLTD
jgi:long-chain acyl-CoA synthetase